jgi:hypothetical protein
MRYLTSFSMSAFIGLAMLSAAHAQTPAAPTAPATSAPAPAAPAAPAPAAPALTARPITPQTHHRMTMAQRFDAANTSHDGHLTLVQAKSANMSVVVKNYDQIDTSKKGYVTLDDIHSYYRARHRTPAKGPSSVNNG